ncbi:MAG: hypothetical protein ABSD90_12770 [Methylocystis sp.]|jgi:hypothetical protein
MGLPEDYVLPSSTQDTYWLTGDGVVAPVVAWLEANLLSRLGAETATDAAPDIASVDAPKRSAGLR